MKRVRRYKLQPTFPLRKVIESEVTGMNRHLKPVVMYMPLEILLNNVCDAKSRSDYAYELQKEGHVDEVFVRKYKRRF
jgi:hypothetical protein